MIQKNLPNSPGVYLMKSARGKILYIGKAANLRRRVQSYFLRPRDSRIQKLVSEIKKIDYEKTDTSLEALILESRLIKKHSPPFNIKDKDDKSFLYVEMTKEKFPRVLLKRGTQLRLSESRKKNGIFGPFVSASAIREALRILRRIFSWSVHDSSKKFKRACFDYEIGLCPGTCVGAISRNDYLKNIRGVRLIFQGKKKKLLADLEKEMKEASKKLEFEKAEKLKRQVFALKHIRDIALMTNVRFRKPGFRNSEARLPKRIEGYDVSNISGEHAAGSMVVFTDGKPDKSEYRKFRIKIFFPEIAFRGTKYKSDDTGMLKEVLRRRLKRSVRLTVGYRIAEKVWRLPDLILIDGGKGQVNAAKAVLSEFNLKIPVVGIAKGPKRKNNIFVGDVGIVLNLSNTAYPTELSVGKNILLRVRDEAHRFAISYHRKLRRKLSRF